jgi:hypothetical protein
MFSPSGVRAKWASARVRNNTAGDYPTRDGETKSLFLGTESFFERSSNRQEFLQRSPWPGACGQENAPLSRTIEETGRLESV